MSKPEPQKGGTVFDLTTAEHQLRQQDAYARNGHAARTLTLAPDLRIVLVAMKEGGQIAAHRADATASIHAIRGHLRLQLEHETVELPAGQLLVLEPGLRHDVEAVAESAFVLTLGWSKGSSG